MVHREVVWVIFGQFRSMSFVVSAAVDAVGMWATRLRCPSEAARPQRCCVLAQRDTGLIRFEDWERERPLQKQFLNLFPAYVEPTINATRNGVRGFKEKM